MLSIESVQSNCWLLEFYLHAVCSVISVAYPHPLHRINWLAPEGTLKHVYFAFGPLIIQNCHNRKKFDTFNVNAMAFLHMYSVHSVTASNAYNTYCRRIIYCNIALDWQRWNWAKQRNKTDTHTGKEEKYRREKNASEEKALVSFFIHRRYTFPFHVRCSLTHRERKCNFLCQLFRCIIRTYSKKWNCFSSLRYLTFVT